jgi:hypothetical protein
MTLAGKVLLGLAGLGVATYAVSEALARSRPKIPPRPSPAPSPSPRPSGPDYAGSGWTGWSHKDVFPDVDAIVQAFRRLGYLVDENLLSSSSMQAVEQFQVDHNLLVRAHQEGRVGVSLEIGPMIDEDSLVGRKTVEALYDALVIDQDVVGGWPGMVLVARG